MVDLSYRPEPAAAFVTALAATGALADRASIAAAISATVWYFEKSRRLTSSPQRFASDATSRLASE
jgi:hypothetical protein